MRPLQIKPRHAITALALSPDGRRLGAVQSGYGFRLFDAITGAELGRDTESASVSELSPTGRHSMHAERTDVRLAEITAGRPFLRFQSGWTRAGDHNRPPAAPGTSALALAGLISATGSFDRGRGPTSWWVPRPQEPVYLAACALTADHRFTVGRLATDGGQFLVCDLADESRVAKLDIPVPPPGTAPVRTAFTPDGTRVVALTPHTLFVFALPPPRSLAPEPLAAVGTLVPPPAQVLTPAVTAPITQPQPDQQPPPFALLPCGEKVIVRGEKSRVELHDLATGAVLTVWKWGLPKVSALAVAGDGLTAAAGGTGGRVVMWDLG